MRSMSTGLGDIEVRKIQLTGGSTYTVSLPKNWVEKMDLKPRDGVKVDWRPSGALRIYPIDMHESQQRVITIDAESLPKESLHDHLMGAYISGAEMIKIVYDPIYERNHRKEIRRFLRNTRGFEIVNESESRVEILSLINAGEMPINSSINRMYSQLNSLIRDIITALEERDLDLISDADERESEVDALLYLIERQVSVALESHVVANALKIGRTQAVEYSNLARTLERMMDHALQISILIHTSKPGDIETNSAPFAQLPVWQAAIKQLMINIRTRNSHQIEEARFNLKDAQNTLVEHEDKLMSSSQKKKNSLLEFRISESVRRLCAYARDFGEILLNIKMYDETITKDK